MTFEPQALYSIGTRRAFRRLLEEVIKDPSKERELEERFGAGRDIFALLSTEEGRAFEEILREEYGLAPEGLVLSPEEARRVVERRGGAILAGDGYWVLPPEESP